MDNQTNSRYDIIIVRDLLTALGLNIEFSDNVSIGGDGPCEGCSAPMVDLSNYEFKSFMDEIVKQEESFINSYVHKCLESNSTIIYTRRMRINLDAKYEKADLNKVMTK